VKIATVGLIGLVTALAASVTACNRAQNQGPDPANANMAPVGQTEPVAQSEAPTPNGGYVANGGYEQQLTQAPAPPPPLPSYSQPPCPGENYMWTPGYWAYSTAGYYWTPGAWVMAPFPGALWTPPYWGYSNGAYILNAGYWGPYVGFYGGIDYGFGYTGRGFYGGYWQGGAFNYNRSVVNVNTTIVRNVYDRRVTNYTPMNRISYNGGNGGVNLRPVASEAAAMRARRMGAAPAQVQYQRDAAANRAQFASVNHGSPSIAAARPAAQPAAVQEERRVTEGEGLRKEGPAVNARPEQRGGFEARGGAPAGNERPAPYQPAQRGPESRQNPAAVREAPENRGFTPGQPAVAARPQMPEQRPSGAPMVGNPAPAQHGFQPGRPAVAARPQMPEQRPSPFRGPAGRPNQAPQPQQEHSADRRMMPASRPQAPAARPAAPEARPTAPQGRPAQGHPEPQHQDRGKHDK
jgi:WXXGXW repeat (2 copies)